MSPDGREAACRVVRSRFDSYLGDGRWLEAHKDVQCALNAQVVGANPSKPVRMPKLRQARWCSASREEGRDMALNGCGETPPKRIHKRMGPKIETSSVERIGTTHAMRV